MQRAYRIVIIVALLFILYHIFRGIPTDFFNRSDEFSIQESTNSIPRWPRPTPVAIIQLDKLHSNKSQNQNATTTGLSWNEAYPKPAFHPINSLAYQTTDPPEEFTIIMLTYTRSEKMLKSLENLIGLPRLNKIIIVWNDVEPPAEDFPWPKLDVQFQIIHPGKNSLNNRFLPHYVVDTEAVLSLDDDVYISHEDVLFAFSVWQEHRNRLVGFPGRGVLWSNKNKRWEYDASICSISLVLTGYVFLHKKYLSIYSHEMPQVIRDRVENTTNCEDIAMNFLVSHISQMAPIKVTPVSEWKCPTCKEDKRSLWQQPMHFQERNACLNFFVEVYGYMPLFKSEYRADDIVKGNAKCTRRSDPKAILTKLPLPKLPSKTVTKSTNPKPAEPAKPEPKPAPDSILEAKPSTSTFREIEITETMQGSELKNLSGTNDKSTTLPVPLPNANQVA